MTAQDKYACDNCMLSFGSIKELVRHYREKHPSLIETVTIPI